MYPSLLQRFRVAPNEIAAERPFIERSIKFTRLAFGLDKLESKEFPAEENLTAQDLKRHESTISNIRLWDHRPLLSTYAQLQEIRPYYKFVDVDNDRYVIDGTYRQIMLSARELSHQHLQSRNWINEHLTFTHGHGVVFGPVNQVTSGRSARVFHQGHSAGGDRRIENHQTRNLLRRARQRICPGANQVARSLTTPPATRMFTSSIKDAAA